MPSRGHKPSSVILDMLSSARSKQRTARSLVSAGALFGFSENTMRVTLSRLMGRGLIESPKRGLYRLTEQTDAVNQFVERWREGEPRAKEWDGVSWLFASYAPATKRSEWALDALGFRAVAANLLARPDNLRETANELKTVLLGLGLEAELVLIEGRPDHVPDRWLQAWQPSRIDAAYEDGLKRLTQSSERLEHLDVEAARLECFSLGGEMIHLLAKDPLLPAQWIDVAKRRALWRATLAYEAQGKTIWAASKEEVLQRMPRPQLEREIA